MTHPTPMPAVFLGHGSPMNTLESNRYTQTWRQVGKGVPTPRAVLVVSAHWFIGVTAVTAMAKPRTIHDFFGFPQKLSEFQYPAPGAPDVAGEIIEVVKPMWCGPDHDSWGLATKEPSYHFDLATRLAPLRKRGVLILASGNVVHNLRRVNFGMRGEGFDWAHRFDEAAREVMVSAPEDVLALLEHKDYRGAAPTPDHFFPLVTLAGLAAVADSTPKVLVDGYDLGSMSMTSFGLGVDCPQGVSDALAADIPEPDVCPTDQTNA